MLCVNHNNESTELKLCFCLQRVNTESDVQDWIKVCVSFSSKPRILLHVLEIITVFSGLHKCLLGTVFLTFSECPTVVNIQKIDGHV